MTGKRLDVERLIHDLGGPSVLSAKIGCSRSLPYKWMERGRISAEGWEDIMTHLAAFGINHIDVSAYYQADE